MGSLIAILLTTLIYLEQAATLSFDQVRLPDAQILHGDVIFRHDSALLYCDSAYFYQQSNSVTAMGHVRFVQGDTLSGFGDILFYNGDTKLARLRRNVRLIHRSTTLTTDSCNYDRMTDLAYYFSGGKIVDSLNVLTSQWGQYYPPGKQASFRTNVHLENPNFTLDCDTLLYNTESHVAKLVSPSTIVYQGETTIYSSNGWYNTSTEKSNLYDQSLIYHVDGRTLTADTIYYDKQLGYGQLRSSLQVVDSAHHSTLYGDYGEVWEHQKHGYATRRALLEEWSDSTTHTYIHADTLFTAELRDTLYDAAVARKDSVLPDSTFIRIRAFRNVRLYRRDAQAVCDSLVYMGNDSIATLYYDPVCWNELNQLSADTMRIYVVDGTIHHMTGVGNALVVQQAEFDTTLFNQMTGKQIEAFVIDDEVRRVELSGNAETIYYPEDNGDYIGMNVTQSSYVVVYLADQHVERVRFTSETHGTLYPMDQIPKGKDHLMPFFWATRERPRRWRDVFLSPERTPRPKAGAISAASDDDEEDNKDNKKKKAPVVSRSRRPAQHK